MERLEAALARFSASLDTLEMRVTACLERAPEADLSNELTGLKLERERLFARIAVLEEESSSLAGITEAVESRLDGAIAEIRAALGRG